MPVAHSDIDPLRVAVRDWLEANVPVNWREAMTGTDQESFVQLQRDWFGKLSQAGYATPHWPEGWPGGGPCQQVTAGSASIDQHLGEKTCLQKQKPAKRSST